MAPFIRDLEPRGLTALRSASRSAESALGIQQMLAREERSKADEERREQAFQFDLAQALEGLQRERGEREAAMEFDLRRIADAFEGARGAGTGAVIESGSQVGPQGPLEHPPAAGAAGEEVDPELEQVQALARRMAPEHRELLIGQYRDQQQQKIQEKAYKAASDGIRDAVEDEFLDEETGELMAQMVETRAVEPDEILDRLMKIRMAAADKRGADMFWEDVDRQFQETFAAPAPPGRMVTPESRSDAMRAYQRAMAFRRQMSPRDAQRSVEEVQELLWVPAQSRQDAQLEGTPWYGRGGSGSFVTPFVEGGQVVPEAARGGTPISTPQDAGRVAREALHAARGGGGTAGAPPATESRPRPADGAPTEERQAWAQFLFAVSSSVRRGEPREAREALAAELGFSLEDLTPEDLKLIRKRSKKSPLGPGAKTPFTVPDQPGRKIGDPKDA